jgi:hypothetical protein
MAQHVHCSSVAIPKLRALRRVPPHYRHILPLEIMKRHQLLVVGCEGRVLTVGIIDQKQMVIIDALAKLTGYTIFPVLMDPGRMRLLLRRMEHWDLYQWHRYDRRCFSIAHTLRILHYIQYRNCT